MGCKTCSDEEGCDCGKTAVIFPRKTREQAKTLAITLAVTAVVVAAVSGAYLLTADRIKANETLFLKRAVLKAAGLQMPREAAAVERLYVARVRTVAGTGRYEVLAEDGAVMGLVLQGAGVGLWGVIRAVVGFDAVGERLTGIEFLEHCETPGLGARIEEAWFRDQFKGKRGPLSLVPEGAPDKENEFDAITGATITSKGVRDLVNDLCRRDTPTQIRP
jgi:Na+-transporting NADH:ubiquinone oxidoreductase subunit C